MIDPLNHFSYFLKKLPRMINRRTRTGIINDIIDVIFHPLFGKYMAIPEVLDFIAHCLNEGKIDLNKFAKYNLPSAMKGVLEFVIQILREEGFYKK